jgi:protein KTI12
MTFLKTKMKLTKVTTVSRVTETVDSQKEKESRGKIMSDVQREIGQDVVVIADSMNYIKGYRYQLYCLARGVKTIHCVVR